MKFCQPHWNRLRASIEAAGMSNLGAKSGEAAINRIKQEMDGTATDETFDPLMSAHWEIVHRFGEPLPDKGLYLMSGDYCPLCELVRLNPRPPEQQPIDENWIIGVTSDLLAYCKEKGLVTSN